MKKIITLSLITLALLIVGGYTTTANAEDTTAHFTQTDKPATDYAWGTGVNTKFTYAGTSTRVTATMTHAFYYGKEPYIIVDIDDDHLVWESIPGENDYMIMWTNIWAWAIAPGSTYQLEIAASGCDHIARSDGATITTYYALVTPGAGHPKPGSFTLAPAFNGNFPNTPISIVNGSPVNYNQDLWARVTPKQDTPAGPEYKDEFYLDFRVRTP
ncbi:MAG: hypothetical protein AB1422_05530 [bacterium]